MGHIIADLKEAFHRENVYIQLTFINVDVFVVTTLIGILLQLFNRDATGIFELLALPASFTRFVWQPWSILTYMSMHAGFLHILFNMLWLYWFGLLFLYFFSGKHLKGLYIVGEICGGLLYIISYNVFPYSRPMTAYSTMVGTSASMLTIVVTTAYREPSHPVRLLFFGNVRLKYLVLIVVLADLLFITSSNTGGHTAHLGGVLAGLRFTANLSKGKDITLQVNKALDAIAALLNAEIWKRKPRMEVHYGNDTRQSDYDYNARKKAQSDEMSRILDKLKKSGYESLTIEEKKSLLDISKRQRMRHIGRLALFLFLAVNAFFIRMLLLTAYSPYINPEVHPVQSCLGLTFPIFLIINFCFLVFWLIVRYRFTLIPLLGFLLCYPQIRTCMPFNMGPSGQPEDSIKFLSYSIVSFGNMKRENGQNPILDHIKNSKADIVCMQEYTGSETAKIHLSNKEIRQALEDYPYRHIEQVGKTGAGSQVACYPKSPILSARILNYQNNCNGSMVYDIKIGKDAALLINNHLGPNKLAHEDKVIYEDMLKDLKAGEVKSGIRQLVNKLAEASAIRSAQAHAITQEIAHSPYPSVIVCGDFNDSPASYAHRTISRDPDDAFAESGRGLGIPYNQNKFYFRIDNILIGENLKASGYAVDNLTRDSDHYPIWCYITLPDQSQETVRSYSIHIAPYASVLPLEHNKRNVRFCFSPIRFSNGKTVRSAIRQPYPVKKVSNQEPGRRKSGESEPESQGLHRQWAGVQGKKILSFQGKK